MPPEPQPSTEAQAQHRAQATPRWTERLHGLGPVIGLAHRVVVMRNGRIRAVLAGEQLSEEELIAHATGTRH